MMECRPAAWPRVLAIHLPGFLICAGVLLLAWCIPFQEVVFEICTLKRWVEIPCPFCGATRSFAAAAKGNLGWAWTNSPLAFLLFCLTGFALLWNAGGLLTRSLWLPGAWMKPPFLTGRRAFWTLFLALCANYSYRLMNGLY